MHNDGRRADAITVLVFTDLVNMSVLVIRNDQRDPVVNILQFFVTINRVNIRSMDSEIKGCRSTVHKRIMIFARSCYNKPPKTTGPFLLGFPCHDTINCKGVFVNDRINLACISSMLSLKETFRRPYALLLSRQLPKTQPSTCRVDYLVIG